MKTKSTKRGGKTAAKVAKAAKVATVATRSETAPRAGRREAERAAAKHAKAAAKLGVFPKGDAVSIKAEKNKIDDGLLDIVGAEFKFDHAKGIAEWIKNSVDAYITTTEAKDAEQYVLLRFKIVQPKKNSVFECIDFVGMEKANIDSALKVWGLRDASKRGKNIATFGGHGNGGKFYMRQMFTKSFFITYRGGLLNVFGFDEKRHYGYADGMGNVSMSLADALKFAGLDGIAIPKEVLDRWKSRPKEAGFTVVRGEGPQRFTGRSTIKSVLERLRTHPQARRILRHVPVIFLGENDTWGKRLELPVIKPREGFETPRVFQLPKKLLVDGEEFDLTALKTGKGQLTLRTSDTPLSRSSELAALNTIDILGEVGCIGSYRMNELGGFLRYAPESEFLYGEVEAPFLEDKDAPHASVANDREKLIKNPLTDALLAWVRERVDEVASEMAEKRNSQKRSQDLKVSSLFNQLLDRWKNQFMVKLTGELFGGMGLGDSFGGSGGGGGGGQGNGKGTGGTGKGDGNGSEGGDDDGTGQGEHGGGGGDGSQKKAGPRFPRVLLSSSDQDPLSDEPATVDCDERHPPVYQRPDDIDAGIFWINTSRALASRILESYGAESPRWREYMFQRYVEIIIKNALYELGDRDPEMTAAKIDGMLDMITARVHDAAAQELQSFLFEPQVIGGVADPDAAEAISEPEEAVA